MVDNRKEPRYYRNVGKVKEDTKMGKFTRIDYDAQAIVERHVYTDLASALAEEAEYALPDSYFEYVTPFFTEGLSVQEVADLYEQVEDYSIVARWPNEIQVWIISNWLAGRLIMRGERVQRVFGENLWSREINGQRIFKDAVIQEIASGNYDY